MKDCRSEMRVLRIKASPSDRGPYGNLRTTRSAVIITIMTIINLIGQLGSGRGETIRAQFVLLSELWLEWSRVEKAEALLAVVRGK